MPSFALDIGLICPSVFVKESDLGYSTHTNYQHNLIAFYSALLGILNSFAPFQFVQYLPGFSISFKISLAMKGKP